jgi:hypothetical protein
LSSLAEIRLTGFDPSIHRLRLSAIDTHGQVIPSYVVTSDPQHVSLPLGKTPGDVILAAGIPVTLLKDEWVIPAGSYPVNRTLIIPRGRRVRFSAGVVLRFAPGTSLVSYAPINVAGTPNAPVVFDESVPGRGWGTFAILSTNASLKPALSSIQSLVCANARGATENGLTFTGGLSCFASDLRVFQSVFVSSGQDDALNVKRSRVTIDECVFINSVADAVDLDWCEASVRRCLFLRSAGDGIDLSGGKIEIEANVILTAADKGVSAGERTNVKISRTLLAGCAIGVASKDGSRVSSEGNTILATQTAWAAYQKKPIFSGGQITSTGDSVMGCDTLERKDRVSRITRTGTRVDLGHQAIQDFASTEKVPQALAALLERLPPSLQGALTGWALTEGDTWTRYPAVN